MAEFLALYDAVRRNLHDGDIVAFEGFTHLIPHAAAQDAIRQGIGNLTLLRMTPDIVYDQLSGMGRAMKVVFSYAGNPGVGLLRRMRDAIENDYPRAIETVEQSHSAMAQAYEAGASGLPCAIFRSEGIIGVQKEAALAARRVVVTVEEVVPSFKGLHPNLTILPHWTIDAISVVPGGAHPSYTHGYYDRDNAAYLEWVKISADREAFAAWMEANVLTVGPEVFADRVRELR